jgi:hypothetical protein
MKSRYAVTLTPYRWTLELLTETRNAEERSTQR